MGYWDQYETVPRETKSGKKTWEETVDKAIENQITISTGGKVKTSKKGVFLQSWRDSDTGLVDPKISNMLLLPQGAKKMSEEVYKKFLQDMEGWRDNQEIKAMIDDIPIRKAQNERDRAEKEKKKAEKKGE